MFDVNVNVAEAMESKVNPPNNIDSDEDEMRKKSLMS